ncbi:MAG TPA: DUF3471 domain-containing protein, partial [Ktedonobacterales bacterium]|nr:DUF3471 domain-containing protein [Ktedonobacterales bacterium]
GAIVSNITEMSHWVLMHLNRGLYKGTRILSEQQVNELHSPQMIVPPQSQYPEIPYASYAMGWAVEPYRGYPMVDHSGGIDGFRSLTTLFPRQQIGIVVLSNLSALNIPEILTYNIFERLMGLDETPWSERFMQEHRGMKAAQQQGKEQAKQKRVEGTSPSHPLEAYTGDYEHPGYGTLSITLNDGKLESHFNGMTFPIRHYHYDIFEFVMEAWDEVLKASFLTNVQGDIDSIVVPFEPTANDIVFKRAPDKQMREQAFLEQFTGIYEFLDTRVVVSLKGEHTLNAAISGFPDYELAPYKGTEFHAKGRSGMSIEFQRDASGAGTRATNGSENAEAQPRQAPAPEGAVTGADVTLTIGVFHVKRKA